MTGLEYANEAIEMLNLHKHDYLNAYIRCTWKENKDREPDKWFLIINGRYFDVASFQDGCKALAAIALKLSVTELPEYEEQ